jgi:23S rRNA pseudouridine2605 synthase
VKKNGTTLIKAMIDLQFASRALALKAIHDQRVTVNDEVATKPNHWVYVDHDAISVDGNPILRRTIKPVTLIYHKPHKLVGSKEEYRVSLYTALSNKKGWYIPSGVLSKAASGIVVVSNDPRHKTLEASTVSKLTRDVWVKVQRLPKKTELTKLSKMLLKAVPEDESILSVSIGQKNSKTAWVKVKTRHTKVGQILRALKELGLESLNVERRRLGPFNVSDLAPGAWYRLMDNHVVALDELAVSGADDENSSLNDVWKGMTEKLFKGVDATREELNDVEDDDDFEDED